MTDRWQDTLARAGMEISPQGGWSFPDEQPATDGGLCPLLDRAWVLVSGSDADGFLHGQVSADLANLGMNRMQPAAYCSPQGRVLAIPRFLRRDGDWLVELPADVAPGIVERWRLFVLRANVDFRLDGDVTAMGVWGERGLARLAELVPLRSEAFGCTRAGALAAVRLPGAQPRVQLIGPAAAMADAFERLAPQLTPAGDQPWRLLEVEAGMPEITRATADRHLPQSLGLDRWQAVNYRKGCYPGQEVIARLHYRGRLKRRLHRATVARDPGAPGAGLQDESGSEAGETLLAAKRREGDSWRLLAVMRDDACNGEVRLASEADVKLTELEPVDATT